MVLWCIYSDVYWVKQMLPSLSCKVNLNELGEQPHPKQYSLYIFVKIQVYCTMRLQRQHSLKISLQHRVGRALLYCSLNITIYRELLGENGLNPP